MEYAAFALALAACLGVVFLFFGPLKEIESGMKKMADGIAQLEVAVKGLINGR